MKKKKRKEKIGNVLQFMHNSDERYMGVIDDPLLYVFMIIRLFCVPAGCPGGYSPPNSFFSFLSSSDILELRRRAIRREI
jgi:hypothetical protein